VPSLTARNGHKARAIFSDAFEKYFRRGGHERGSDLVQARYRTCEKYGISVEDTACFEVAGVLAILVNTIPTAFWMMYYIFSDPRILDELRAELSTILNTTTNLDGVAQRILDITAIKERCPLLGSIFQETLRHRSLGSSTREVLKDTVLADRFLLKKGAIIQIPSLVVHADPTIWGTTVMEFDIRRFVKQPAKDLRDHKQHPGAFRAFGGGTTLCPGRHFASIEIMTLVGMFVMRYDISPVSGEWCMPPQDASNLAAAIMYPGQDVDVEITPRKGYEDGSWTFQLMESTSHLGASKGDGDPAALWAEAGS
jgi:cytochrome P450